MDFDIGNILYVLITLVAIIVSLMGKKKKPAGKQSKPGFFENLEAALKMEQEDPVVMDLGDHEPDLAEEGDMYKAEPVEEPVQEVSVPESETSALLREYEELMVKRGGSPVEALHTEGESVTDSLELVQLEDEDEVDYFEIVKDFDAGTAVIYSAIINRLDY